MLYDTARYYTILDHTIQSYIYIYHTRPNYTILYYTIQYRAIRGRTLSQKSSCNCRNFKLSTNPWVSQTFFHRGARGTALRSAFQAGCTPGVHSGCARTWNTHHSQLQCNWEVLLIQQQVEHIQTKDLIPEQNTT